MADTDCSEAERDTTVAPSLAHSFSGTAFSGEAASPGLRSKEHSAPVRLLGFQLWVSD